jgi:hypothetical protein
MRLRCLKHMQIFDWFALHGSSHLCPHIQTYAVHILHSCKITATAVRITPDVTPSHCQTIRRSRFILATFFPASSCLQLQAEMDKASFSFQLFLQIPLDKRRFSVISKCRHMHEVLNVDEIKN